MTDRLAIYVVLAGCLVLGTVVVMELAPAADTNPARAGISGRPGAAPPAVHRPMSEMIEAPLATALGRPLFSTTRRPPQSAVGDAGSDLADTRLTGIITEPDRRIAIFAVHGAKPLRLTEGEAVSGWRIESITPREVSLSGPSGTKTLEPKLDPSLGPQGPSPVAAAAARPPGAPAPAAAAAPRPGVPPVPSPAPPRPGRAERRQ